jgi:hypothetical protein
VSEVTPGHLKFKFQRLLNKKIYWPPKLQLYGPPYISLLGYIYNSEMPFDWSMESNSKWSRYVYPCVLSSSPYRSTWRCQLECDLQVVLPRGCITSWNISKNTMCRRHSFCQWNQRVQCSMSTVWVRQLNLASEFKNMKDCNDLFIDGMLLIL